LVALAGEGRQIVRLIVAPVDPTVIQALAAASVAVEVLMAAPNT
jgi:precorrin-2 dehydrogenase/sirohydrochlorin ferrochelatase